ncbi:MAG: hypothetical protein L0I24_19570 [Pseudonocardia sp.]|nr:hypothetical protein [Pseudonocardia sp.]
MARSTPADYREFVRLSVDLPMNPKLAMIDDPAAGWAYVTALCYCGGNLTDGSFPQTVVMRLAGVKTQVARSLFHAGLWHESGHDCPRCPDPSQGQVVIHDYLDHQRSSDEAKALREARREAGRKGAHSRWSPDDDGKSHSKSHTASHSKSDGKAMADGWQSDDRAMAEVEGEEEKKTSSSSTRRTSEPQRDDVDHLCRLLVEHAERYDNRTPTVSQAWRKAMRLLLDTDLALDADPLALAVRVFEFMQADDFWPPNILSAPTFRKQFPKLRAKAKHEWEQAQRGPTGRHLAVAQQGTASQRSQAFLNLRKGGEPA